MQNLSLVELREEADKSIRVLLVDGHKIMRQGVKALLEHEQSIVVVAEAASGQEAILKSRALAPDVVVMDLIMQEINAVETTRQILSDHPGVRVLGFSMALDRNCVVETLRAGAAGYLSKLCAAEELVGAIHSVAAGTPYLCPQATSLVLQNIQSGNENSLSQLSKREREVLRLLADGKGTKEIAFTFGVSIKTIEVQRTSISKKLNLFSVAELTKYAIREGLTSIE